MVMALFLSIVAVSIALVVMIIVNLNFKQNGAAETCLLYTSFWNLAGRKWD